MATQNPAVVSVGSQVFHKMSEGLGFNWYSCYAPATYPKPDDEQRWQRIFHHADWLNMTFIRYGQSASAISDDTGSFKPGHDSFKQLQRLDQWAQKRGTILEIDPFSVPKPFQYEKWPGAPGVWGGPNCSLGVEDIDGYVARFVVPYVRYVVEELKCRSVRWFNCANEPLNGGVMATPEGVDDHVRYVEVLKAIRQGFDENGLKHIGLMAPDTSTHNYWPIPRMLAAGADPDPYIQAYCMHQYHSHFDWDKKSSNMGSSLPVRVGIGEQLRKYCQYAHAHGKPYLVTEVGMFHYGWRIGDPAGIARHDNTLLELEFIIRGMREGADGFLRWAWLNPGNIDGWWQLIQTVDGTDAPVQNPYYGYGTLMRHVDRNAEILTTEVEQSPGAAGEVHAVAVANSDGSRTIALINDTYADPVQVVVRVKDSAMSKPMRKIVCDPVRKYQECPAPAGLSSGAGEWQDMLSPMSITVYTTKQNT